MLLLSGQAYGRAGNHFDKKNKKNLCLIPYPNNYAYTSAKY
jgi:hypothetical protein